MTEAWIIDACRTPRGIGKPGRGALTEIHPQRLGCHGVKSTGGAQQYQYR